MTRVIILSVLFIWTAANAMSELPRLNVEELAEYMEMGAERLKTLRVTAHITQSALTREDGKSKAIEGEFVQRAQFYRMKHDDRFHYSRYGDGREVAYNGEFTTRSNGHGAGIISSVSNAGRNPGLDTLYNSNIQDKYCDYFAPPSMWRVSYLDDVMFEGEPCYVLMVTVRDGEPENGEYEVPWSNEYTGIFYKMVVCPRFGFGFCVVEHISGRMEKGEIVKTVTSRKFSGFHEVAPNVWFPRHSQVWSNRLGYLTREYSDISVNEPIDDREFVVQFKPGTWVEDRRTGQFYDIPHDDQAAKDLIKSLVGEIKNETEENRPKDSSDDFDGRALD